MTSLLSHRDEPSLRYRLHRLALAGGSAELQPGYRRTEERMRRQLPAGPVLCATVDDALLDSSLPDDDRAWFLTRDEAEAPQRARQAEALAASPFGPLALCGPAVGVVFSAAIRAVPALAPRSGLVAAGPDTPPSLVWLGACALPLFQDLRASLPELPLDTARFAAFMLAGQQACATGLADRPLEALLSDLVKTLLPPQHRREETEAMLHACREAGLVPEHPGEFERMVHGIPRRRGDRIHRAWLRRSFVAPPVGAKA